MKRGKSAQSEIITTVLIILLVLAAIVIVWTVVKRTVVTGTEGIGTLQFTTQLDIEKANMYVSGGGEVRVKRGVGKGDITALKFIFYSESGESIIIEKTDNLVQELETKNYGFTAEQINISIAKVSVVPVFGKNLGSVITEENINSNLPVAGLISWWKFDGNTMDSVGDNDGNITGVGNDANTAGNVLNLDGNNDYVSVPANPSLAFGTGNFSLSVWINTSLTNNNLRRIIYHDNYYLMLNNNRSQFALTDGSGSITGIKRLNAGDINKWHHVVVVRNINATHLYFNGISDGTGSEATTTPVVSAQLQISRGYAGLESWNGTIDNVMIFNKALSNAEIQALYNNQKK